ncbi:MAG: hypothetical protein ACYTEQ_30855 [Planctomycetota bacterium]|jgi:hypothetical protein
MAAKVKRMVGELLVLFFLLEAVVFGLHAALKKAPKRDQNGRYVVEVTSAGIEWLRRRLAQKTEFLFKDLAQTEQATDAQ